MKMHSPYLKLLHIEFIAFTNLCLKRHIALGARYLRKEKHFFTQLLLSFVVSRRLDYYGTIITWCTNKNLQRILFATQETISNRNIWQRHFLNDRYGAVNG